MVGVIEAPRLGAVMGVTHAFTTREGGVSEGSYRSLNLSTSSDDPRSNARENRDRVLAHLGRADARFVALRQVHGAQVVQVTAAASRSIEADGLWSRDRGAALAILVADCVPILFANRQGTVIGAVHAGWRGTRDKIPAVMVTRLVEAGVDPSDLVVALGPAISQDNFEIGPDVASELRAAFPEAGEAIRAGKDDRSHADLWALNHQTLVAAGVAAGAVEVLRVCTVDQPELFSHRRDDGVTGRQAGVIAFSSP
ncbi:MAG: peptidoglycan editing factor PgeF [Myxococcota bacterium]